MFYISPSRIARYFYHECERYLRFHSTPKNEREQLGIPDPPYDQSPVTRAILEGGYVWETKVVDHLLHGKVKVAKAEAKTPLKDRTFDSADTLKELQSLKPGEYLYQGTLMAPSNFYSAYGLDRKLVEVAACRPDLVQAVPLPDGNIKYRVIDVKASDALKTSHKVQTAMYVLVLQHLLEENGLTCTADINEAGVWLYEAREPEIVDLKVIRPHVEAFLREDLARILTQDPQATAWHLNYRCEWCEYFKYCFTEAQSKKSVSLIPYMTNRGRNYLRKLQINSLNDLQGFLKNPSAGELLAQCASLAGKEDRLRESVESLLNGSVRPFGGTSLAMPKGENIRLILTMQREPVSGKTYAAALLRTGSDAIFTSAARHEEQYVASSPTECDQVRRTFIRRLYAIMNEIHQYNADRDWAEQKSLQTYVFDSYEAELLNEMLLESLTDRIVAEEAVSLLFYFQSENLISAEEHPASETHFPKVILTDVIRSLFALPVPVAYHLADIVSALPPSGKDPFKYKARDYYNFRLSNALRSDAIHAVWHHGKIDYIDRIARELRMRLWAAASVLEGIRAAAVDPRTGRSLLFAWPPKFCLPDRDTFRHPLLSKLAFLARYESLMSYLQIRAGRIRPRAERERTGVCFSLRALDGRRFLAEPFETAMELEADSFSRWLLTEDSPDGDEAQMAFPDYSHRDKHWVPKGKKVCFAAIQGVDVDVGNKQVILTLNIKNGQDSPAILRGKSYLLHPSFIDWNSSRVVSRLREIDAQGDPPVVSLLSDPVKFCRNLKINPTLKREILALVGNTQFTPSQQKAFNHLLEYSLTLVWGPPGTGKTHFLALAILTLLEAHRKAGLPLRVLISAFTHAAIENCLKKIEELRSHLGLSVPVVKLGDVRTVGAQELDAIRPDEGTYYLQKHPFCAIGATTYGLFKLFKDDPNNAPFDLVVLDEGSQVRIPEALLVISRLAPTGRLLIAGDDMQLPPIIQGKYPEPKPGEPLLHRSIFEALRVADRKNELTSQLYENFRMNDSLCCFPAEHLYGPEYCSATPMIASRRIRLAQTRKKIDPWIEMVLDPDYPLVLCVLEGIQAGAENVVEAGLVAQVTHQLRRRLLMRGRTMPYPDDKKGDNAFWRDGVFIVSPHHAQIRSIHLALAQQGLREPFFIDTVEKMQGQECDVVIVSYGVSDAEYAMLEGEFIYSLNRLNVAITRARSKCIVFLPRPLLTPTLQVLEQEEAAQGIAYMLTLERHVAAGQTEIFDCNFGRLTVYRTR